MRDERRCAWPNPAPLAVALVIALAPAASRGAEQHAPLRPEPREPAENDGAPPAEPETKDDTSASLGVEVDLDSRFIWRGIAFSQSSVAQPSLWASWLGFTGTLWANVMLNDEPRHDRSTSLVPALVYAYTRGALKIEPGGFVYASPGRSDRPATAEGSVDASYSLGAARIVSGTKVDLATYRWAYFGTLGAEYEHASHGWTMKALLQAGWGNAKFNQVYLRRQTAALNLAELGVSVRRQISDRLYVAPHAELFAVLVPLASSRERERILMSGGVALGLEL